MNGYEKVKDLDPHGAGSVELFVCHKMGWILLAEGASVITFSRDEIRALRDYLNHEWVDPDAGKKAD